MQCLAHSTAQLKKKKKATIVAVSSHRTRCSSRNLTSTSADVLIRFGNTTGMQWGRCSRDAAEIRYLSITIGTGLHVVPVMQTAYLLFLSRCPICALPMIDGHSGGEDTHPPLALSSPLDFYLQSELPPSVCCNNSRSWEVSRAKDILAVTCHISQAEGSP